MNKNLKILLCLTLIISAISAQGFSMRVSAVKYLVRNPTDSEYVIFTETNVRTTDMRAKSKLDAKQFTEYMQKFPCLAGIEDALLKIQDEYNVNALLILAIVRLESGNGKSSIAQSKNNLGGLIVSQNSVAVYKSFDTKSDCIIYMAKLLSENYLTKGGKYFNGYTLPDIAQRYSTSPDAWTDLVGNMLCQVQKGIDEIPKTN